MKAAQSCLALCDPMNCSVPDSSVPGIFQKRTLEWVAMPSSRQSSQPRDRTQVSHTAGRFFTDGATRKAQEYWSGEPIPSPGEFLTQKLNRVLLHYRQILYQLNYQGSPNRKVPLRHEIGSLDSESGVLTLIAWNPLFHNWEGP